MKTYKNLEMSRILKHTEVLINTLIREKGYCHTEALIMSLSMVEYFHQLVSNKILEKPYQTK